MINDFNWHVGRTIQDYLCRLDSLPSVREQQGEGAPPLHLADRLVYRGEDKREERVFAFSLQEVRAIKEMITVLEQPYAQGLPSDKTSVVALEYLAAWRLLIEEAEQHTHARIESR